MEGAIIGLLSLLVMVAIYQAREAATMKTDISWLKEKIGGLCKRLDKESEEDK